MAVYKYEPPRVRALGNSDGSISQHMKCWINQGDTFLCAVIGEGSSVNLSSAWGSPIGDSAGMVDGALQVTANITLRNALTSTQIWQGNQPLDIVLNLNLYALNDPESEVESVIDELRKFASPELSEFIPVSQAPQTVMLNLRRRLILPKCAIESVSDPFDAVVDANGARISATVAVSLSTQRMMSRSEL